MFGFGKKKQKPDTASGAGDGGDAPPPPAEPTPPRLHYGPGVSDLEPNIGDFLYNRARLAPDREAWVDVNTGRRFSYQQFNERANRCAHVLAGLGVAKGDRVAVLAMNSIEFMETFFGLAKLGAVCVTLNWRLTPAELEFILKDAGATVLVYSGEFKDTVANLQGLEPGRTDLAHWLAIGGGEGGIDYDAALAAADSSEPVRGGAGDDNLYIMYTSGTTGLPKGVVHTHDSAFWATLTVVMTNDQRQKDRYYCCLPLFHVGALTPAMVSVYNGETLVVPRSFDPVAAWRTIEEEKINTMLAVPAMLGAMKQTREKAAADISSLRSITSGAAPVPVTLIKDYASWGIEIRQVYGLTETCGPACIIDSERALEKAGSTGPAFLHSQVRVVRPDGTDCAAGENGEVLVRGRHIMKEYWNRPEATAETLKDGWLHTGDLASMDEDGFVTVRDRLKDMIISGGENIYPAEVENVLLGHPKVRDAAVIGQDSERWGEVPLAVVVKADDSLTEAELVAHCQDKLARYKQPKAVRFVAEIPRNPTGKVLKRVLREQFPEPAPE